MAALLVSTPALADDDAATLSTQLDRDVAALSTSDCGAACKALASIRRAAERICALEPGGPRCDAARAKADDATRRVREACPDCAEAAMTPPPAATKPDAAEAAPPRGGCRSCTVATAPDAGDFAVFGLAVALAALVRKRRRRV